MPVAFPMSQARCCAFGPTSNPDPRLAQTLVAVWPNKCRKNGAKGKQINAQINPKNTAPSSGRRLKVLY